MEREKFIDEMAKIIKKTYEKHGVFNPKWFAEAIYDKIFSDGAVVLSRDKYNELRSRPTNCTYIDISKDFVKECQKEIENAVKERTIAIIKDLIGHRFAYYVKDETNGTVTCCADYVVDEDDVKFLEEKYNVEVKNER